MVDERYTDYADINVKGKIQSSTQGRLVGSMESMPEASQKYEGQTIIYSGQTGASFTQNRSYTCVETSTDVYEWVDSTPSQELNLTQSRALVSDQNGDIASSSVTSTEVGYLSGVTSGIQSQINTMANDVSGKQGQLSQANAGTNITITGEGDNIIISGQAQVSTSWGNISGDIDDQTDLNNTFQKKDVGTQSVVVVTDANGEIQASGITQTELGYLDNATGNIQSQINALDTDKLDQNTALASGGTATKITYDTKGLVTGAGSLVQSDIPDLSSTYQVVGDYATNTSLGAEATARQNADTGLQDQIDALQSKSDVVDVVQTYADLQAYDTTKLSNNDIVKVLSDSTHSNQESYYRWVITSGTGAWNYIGSLSASYTKAETDALLVNKMGTNMLNADLGSQNQGKYLKVTQTGGVEYDVPDISGKADTDLSNVDVGSGNAGKYVQVATTGELQYTEVDMSSKADTDLSNVNVGSTKADKFPKVSATGALSYVQQETQIANNKQNPPTTTAVYTQLNQSQVTLSNNSTGTSDIGLQSHNYATNSDTANTLFVSKKDLTNTNVGSTNSGKFLQVTAQGQIGYAVPTDTKYTAGDGLVLSGTVFTPNVSYTTSGKNYQVQVDTTTKGLYVNVPWTDTVTSVTTSGSGNAITAISASNGQITATKGSTFATSAELTSGLSGKQDTLVGSGTGQNIKTINSSSILGTGDIALQTPLTAGTDYQTPLTFDTTPTASSTNPVTSGGVKTALDGKQATLVSGTNIKTVNGNSLLGSGDIAQVQADWNEADTSDPSYIQNKPTIINGYEYLNVSGLTSLTTIATNQTVVYQLSMDQSPYGGSDYDFIIICEPESGITISNYQGTGTSAYFTIKNCGPELPQFTFLVTTYVYRRPKQGSTHNIVVIGSTSGDCVRASELPTLGTAGKVLTVNSGATGVEWANVPSELPATLGTAGQVLSVNSGATGVEWASILSGYTFVVNADIVAPSAISPGSYVVASVDLTNYGGQNNDYIAFCNPSGFYVALGNYYSLRASSISVAVTNCGSDVIASSTVVGKAQIYSRPKEGTNNKAVSVGGVGKSAVRPQELPATLGTAGQVLSVNSGATGVEWVTPVVKFTSQSCSSWASDATYTDYGYKGTIALTGVTASDVAQVIFGMTEATSGDYAPICETYAGGVYIYSKVNTTITIPTILITKQ